MMYDNSGRPYLDTMEPVGAMEDLRKRQQGTRFRPEQGRLILALQSLAKLLEKPVDTADYRNLCERLKKTIVTELAAGSDMYVAMTLLKDLSKREDDALNFAQQIGAQPGEIIWHAILNYAQQARESHRRALSVMEDELGMKEQEIERLKRELATAEERASRPVFKTFKTIGTKH